MIQHTAGYYQLCKKQKNEHADRVALSKHLSVLLLPLISIRYQVKCGADKQPSCTADSNNTAAWIWQYKPLNTASCQQMQTIAAGEQPKYREVFCCNSNLCNKPDPALDKETYVQEMRSAADVVAGIADVQVRSMENFGT